MNIFLTGATGFIGGRLALALAARGHALTCGLRTARCAPRACAQVRHVDFARDFEPAAWQPLLEGMEILVNAVGMIRERAGRMFEDVHVRAPVAMFAAARTAGVRRIIQISALGADAGARSAYHLSKRTADDYLAGLPVDWVVVQPSLVFGSGGASARLFTMLASLPWIPLPGQGDQRVQPIHVEDLVEALVALVESPQVQRRVVPLVGPAPLQLSDYLAALRGSLALGPARFVRVPGPLVAAAATLSGLFAGGLMDRDTLEMLDRGNTADPGPTTELLGRAPRPASRFVSADPAGAGVSAQLAWLLPCLRWSVALVWIATAIVSVAGYPYAGSLELLARTGIPAGWAPITLYAAAALDLLLGIASVSRWRRPGLWLLQIAVILAYTLIITFRLPEFWLHPFGPVLKNLPMLAALVILYVMERR
jgi:uncharacterized protein YbjT (DUF2867 family)